MSESDDAPGPGPGARAAPPPAAAPPPPRRVDHTYRDYARFPADQLPRGRGAAANFPAKLHRILQAPEFAHIISWMPHGRAWKIHNKDLLVDEVIPQFFTQTKYHSFSRQVNGWGFKRLHQAGGDYNAFYHECFLRGHPELTGLMKRVAKNLGKQIPHVEDEPNFYEIAQRFPLPPAGGTTAGEGWPVAPSGVPPRPFAPAGRPAPHHCYGPPGDAGAAAVPALYAGEGWPAAPPCVPPRPFDPVGLPVPPHRYGPPGDAGAAAVPAPYVPPGPPYGHPAPGRFRYRPRRPGPPDLPPGPSPGPGVPPPRDPRPDGVGSPYAAPPYLPLPARVRGASLHENDVPGEYEGYWRPLPQAPPSRLDRPPPEWHRPDSDPSPGHGDRPREEAGPGSAVALT